MIAKTNRTRGPLDASPEDVLRLAVALCFLVSVHCLIAGVVPLTGKDVSLMLRSGYSSEAVLREISVRRFADTFDSAMEKQFVQAGATPALIEALRSGAYQSSPSEIAAAKQKQAAQAKRATEAAAVTHETDQPGDNRVSANLPPQVQTGGTMYDHLKDDLVYWHAGALVPFDDESLENKKFYLLFFSAISSRAGYQFTRDLVDYYNRTAPQHPEFEVIFFSADRSPFAMQNYISQTNMPWPALAFEKRDGKAGAIQGNLVHEIPCLILADASGKILSYTDSEKRLSADRVLADLDRLLSQRQ